MGALRLRKHMVILIDFLGLVLVAVQAQLVVIGVKVLPLGARLDTQQLHEVLDLEVAVLAAERFACSEESVFEFP